MADLKASKVYQYGDLKFGRVKLPKATAADDIQIGDFLKWTAGSDGVEKLAAATDDATFVGISGTRSDDATGPQEILVYTQAVVEVPARANEYKYADELKYNVAAGAVEIVTGAVDSIIVTAAGTGYTSVPTVGFSGGAGSGAAGTAVLTGGVLTSVTMTNGGKDYTTSPTVAITGGGGASATAIAPLNLGSINALALTDGGTGYTTGSLVETAGDGTSFAGTFVAGAGIITSVLVTDAGEDYTTITIDGDVGGNADAVITATITSAENGIGWVLEKDTGTAASSVKMYLNVELLKKLLEVNA